MDQSEIVPFNVHGVLECVLRFFNQKEIGVIVFCKEIDIGEVETNDFPRFDEGALRQCG